MKTEDVLLYIVQLDLLKMGLVKDYTPVASSAAASWALGIVCSGADAWPKCVVPAWLLPGMFSRASTAVLGGAEGATALAFASTMFAAATVADTAGAGAAASRTAGAADTVAVGAAEARTAGAADTAG